MSNVVILFFIDFFCKMTNSVESVEELTKAFLGIGIVKEKAGEAAKNSKIASALSRILHKVINVG